MALIAYCSILVFLTWLLLTRVRDGFTYLPVVGGGLGLLIGRELVAVLGDGWDWLPAALGGGLLVAPFLVLIVANQFSGSGAQPPSPARRAKLEAKIAWQPYDPGWLVTLARTQYPRDSALCADLSTCTRMVEHKGRVYFIPPRLLSRGARPIWTLTTDTGAVVSVYRNLWSEVAAIEQHE